MVFATQSEGQLPKGARFHYISQNETPESIAKRYNLPLINLVSANLDLENLNKTPQMDKLVIPGSNQLGGLIIQLQKGQKLTDLTAKYGVSADQIARASGLNDYTKAKTGDYFYVPGRLATDTLKNLQALQTNEQKQQLVVAQQVQADIISQLILRQVRTETLVAMRAAEARRQAALAKARADQQRAVAKAKRTTQGRTIATNYHAYNNDGLYNWPLSSFTITSPFGRRSVWIGGANLSYHTGVDLAAPYGTPIYAAHAGRIIQAGWGFLGITTGIDIGDGIVNYYGHQSRVVVGVGQQVERGQLIGYIGMTGYTTGPHLHFEVQVNKSPVNPMPYLSGAARP